MVAYLAPLLGTLFHEEIEITRDGAEGARLIRGRLEVRQLRSHRLELRRCRLAHLAWGVRVRIRVRVRVRFRVRVRVRVRVQGLGLGFSVGSHIAQGRRRGYYYYTTTTTLLLLLYYYTTILLLVRTEPRHKGVAQCAVLAQLLP